MIYIHANAIIADETKYTGSVLWLCVVIQPPNEKERAAPKDKINVLKFNLDNAYTNNLPSVPHPATLLSAAVLGKPQQTLTTNNAWKLPFFRQGDIDNIHVDDEGCRGYISDRLANGPEGKKGEL